MAGLALDETHALLYGTDINGGNVYVFSLPSLATVSVISVGAQSQPLGIDVSPDGKLLAVTRVNSAYRNIALIDTATKAITTLTPFSGVPWAVHFGPLNSGRLYSAGFPIPGSGIGDCVHVWNISSPNPTEVGHSDFSSADVESLAITADGKSLYESRIDQTGVDLARYDISTDSPVAGGATPGVQFGGGVAVKADGSVVYSSNGEAWSGDLQTRLGTLPGPNNGHHAAYGAGGNMAVVDSGPDTTNTSVLSRADGTTFAATGTRHVQQTDGMTINSAGTVVYESSFEGGPNSELLAVDFAAPDAPSGVTARAGIGSALVAWSPPADSGTSPISGYDVISSGGARLHVPASQTSAVLTGLSPVPHTFRVDAVNASGAGPASAPYGANPQAGGTYHSLSPARILDTRSGNGAPIAPIGQGGVLNVQVAGRGGVPTSGVSAVVVNVTVTDTTADSFLTVWPTGTTLPTASSLNWVAGRTVANLVEVALGSGGQLSLYNLGGQTDVVMDVEGWVGDSTNSSSPLGMFNSLAPSRLLDTRSGNGAPIAPIGPGGTLTLQVTGRGGVPASGVSAVVLNVTATDTTADSFLTLYPTGQALPVASNLNWTAGQTLPNRVTVPVGANGQVNLFNLGGDADVVVDVNGWFTDATNQTGGSGFVATVPARVFDERRDLNGPLPGGFYFTLGLVDTLPMTAVALNVTVTDTTAPSFLTVWPYGQPLPNASDLNWVAGMTVPNMVVVGLAPTGQTFNGLPVRAFNVYNFQGLVDVVIDVTGFYTGVVQPLSPLVASAPRAAVAGSIKPELAPVTHTPTSVQVARQRA